jgi:hypothetical protein
MLGGLKQILGIAFITTIEVRFAVSFEDMIINRA